MVESKAIHWYIGSRCNASPACTYCFEHDYPFYDTPISEDARLNSGQHLGRIAKKLASLGIPKIILGGGEPLLANNLWGVLDTLREGGSSIDIHTNGILLYQDPQKVERLKDAVDSIDIPLDSFDPAVQSQLRHYDTIKVFRDVFERLLADKRTKVGIHTVATTANLDTIPELYREIRDRNFDNWRVYEINVALAYYRLAKFGAIKGPEGCNRFIDTFQALKRLAGLPKVTNIAGILRSCQFAKSVLDLEGKLEVEKDPRVGVVLLDDHPEDYVFLNNAGDIFSYSLKSPGDVGERTRFGNIFSDDFEEIMTQMAQREVLRKQDRVRFHFRN